MEVGSSVRLKRAEELQGTAGSASFDVCARDQRAWQQNSCKRQLVVLHSKFAHVTSSATKAAELCQRREVITQALWHVRFPRGVLEDAVGSSVTTGGLHFPPSTPLSVHLFFSVTSKKISPLSDVPHRKSEKKVKTGKKCFEPVVVCYYSRKTLGHLCWLQLLHLWLYSCSYCLKLTITSSNRLLSHLRARASPGNVKSVLQ
jgi:hypothetical protein